MCGSIWENCTCGHLSTPEDGAKVPHTHEGGEHVHTHTHEGDEHVHPHTHDGVEHAHPHSNSETEHTHHEND